MKDKKIKKVKKLLFTPIFYSLYCVGGLFIMTFAFSGFWKTKSQYNNIELFLMLLISFIFFYLLFYDSKIKIIDFLTDKNIIVIVRGILIFLFFFIITEIYWHAPQPEEDSIKLGVKPAIYGITSLFAALIILINTVYFDLLRKREKGLYETDEFDNLNYQSKLEYLKCLNGKYNWNMKVAVSAFFGIAVAFSWKASSEAGADNEDLFERLKWAMIIATYGSIGILLILNQLIEKILKLIRNEILCLKK